jgi:hypothetical protein
MWNTYHTKYITEAYLYKFLTVECLVDFLKTGKIWFARADTFLDQMECAHIFSTQRVLDQEKFYSDVS